MMKSKFVVIKLTILFSLLTTFAYSQKEEIRKKNFNVAGGIAIAGYDPVSYFDHKPLKGKSDYSYKHEGITYLFANENNLKRFKTSVDKYEPEYGGWCAYAMGESGEKVKIDPETYKIYNGKLYLFYNFWLNNTLKDWNKDEAKLKQNADLNWKKILH